ncbi:helix-turn-helix domain-containing protein [Parapedobacter tibetensis]|uniref:helix-turn-helix domain-containing protein n=1 Tax=Parapedobacter tibetensis TaxID=2972951 RepID=UPI00214D2093|nr:helix-turn-helix domain-containing protein [Parapedobacter tibetensis]
MSESHSIDTDFLAKVTVVVMENLSNERFGVSELAEKMHMSRSNLLRRIKHSTNSSVSRLIREIRLKQGMELLGTTSLSVSEVSHQVGFSGTSYFIKCFREYYGYPPGEASKRKMEAEPSEVIAQSRKKIKPWVLVAISLGAVIALGLFIYLARRPASLASTLDKSIAVLPFKNDSDDSTNVYLINGLMESTLNNLQKINDLRVVSRTSAEKYRHTAKSIPELAHELQVSYVVEGSGQKIGNRILLNIQLIDARHDNHLWARRYEREVTDIFQLQQEIAKDIAKEVRAIVTWEERKRIERTPTTDLVAYDLFLKATELMRQGGGANLEAAIALLEKAIERDREFALAYAVTAIAYHYLDVFQQQPQYVDTIGSYADKALLYDPALAESLFAKGLHYVNQKSYVLAIPYLEKALEYNPNSTLVIHFLSDFYNWYVPNTAKYLEYALQGIRLDPAAHDSATASFNYLHLSNALVQTGFIDESLRYIEQSLAYNPDNSFAQWLNAVVVYAKYRDSAKAEKLLLSQLAKDSNQMHILQELGKLYFHTGDDQAAFRYYERFLQLREEQQLDFFHTVDLDMAILWSKRGNREKSERHFSHFKTFADNDQSIYRHMHLALYAAYRGNASDMIDHLRLFSKEDNYQYWILLFKDDIMVARFKDNPAFKAVFDIIETKFWDKNKQLKETLEEKGLL